MHQSRSGPPCRAVGDKKQIQCVVRPLQILRADGTWENIGGMK
ncbi:TPA: phage tail fiber C-terminal domain-containing protein [Escherichia coli]|nr:hypothetical protein [Escherichia coli]EEU2382931.1 hypothetical protein [Escherichia coli]EEV6352375.1 hypothetical protein [Escherichia coli]EEV6388624.1 hypothetical protein [Escherichia coli]EEV6398550.1 hypothetical protein [Escherichia coli]